MDCTPTHLPYEQTGYFSKIVIDYLKGDEGLKPFYAHPPTADGIKAAIEERKKYPTDRKLLVTQLQQQYAGMELNEKLASNIAQLSNENTFTITTAHQPNIFTGHLYFVYKILHAVKLAADLKAEIPECNFVPVFYMGSEDADLDELGQIYLFGEKYEWKTKQTGAVGRMKVDKELIQLLAAISGQLLVLPYGEEMINLIKDCYVEGDTIEKATFKFTHELFGAYGLVVLLPDNAALKTSFIPVVEKEITTSFSYHAVEATAAVFPKAYKVQAGGREINLFYLIDANRARIVGENSRPTGASGRAKFKIQNSKLEFTNDAIIEELHQHPGRFSPNVILRPVYQEMILPNIAFIGGGGEIAYWLELKKVFAETGVPFPVLLLRNSFLIVEQGHVSRAADLGFAVGDLFKDPEVLLNVLVKRDSEVQLNLEKEKSALKDLYSQMKNIAAVPDISLEKHVEALQAKALQKVDILEKKMLKAEKKKFEAQQRQLHKFRSQLFPNNSLQERVENILPFYAKFGRDFIQMVYDNSKGLEQEFGILIER